MIQKPKQSSSVELAMGRVIADGGILVSNLNRLLGHARHAEVRDQFAAVFIKMRHLSRSDLPRILSQLRDLKYYASKLNVEFETEKRNSVIRPIDTSIDTILENTSQLLRVVDGALADIEQISSDGSGVYSIPEQSLAPLKVRISDGRLTVEQDSRPHQKNGSPELSGVRKHLKSEFARVYDDIQNTNVDRRFLRLVKVFENLLENETDSRIIALGMHVRLTEQALRHTADDLPDICAVEARGFLANINSYVNQFTDWSQFLELARSEEIDATDSEEVGAVADKVKLKLEQSSDVVDPDVPRSVALVREFLKSPRSASKTSIYALIRSIENVFIGLIKFVFDKTAELASKSATRLIDAISDRAPYALLVLLLSLYPDFLPLVLKIKSLAWIEEYVAFLRDLFSKLKH